VGDAKWGRAPDLHTTTLLPTPAFPAPPAEPGYYTAQSVVVSQRYMTTHPVIGGAKRLTRAAMSLRERTRSGKLARIRGLIYSTVA
jgi:hypothetical protein